MRKYIKISPKIWINETGRKIKKLGWTTQLVSLYLQVNSHVDTIGESYLPIHLIAHETGLNQDTVLQAIHRLSEINFCRYDEETEYMTLCIMAVN